MMRTAVLVIVCSATAFLAGLGLGEIDAPGTIRVPAKSGTPADLPAWACEEIVEHRMQQWEESMNRHLDEGERPQALVWHYPVLGVCRGDP